MWSLDFDQFCLSWKDEVGFKFKNIWLRQLGFVSGVKRIKDVGVNTQINNWETPIFVLSVSSYFQ